MFILWRYCTSNKKGFQQYFCFGSSQSDAAGAFMDAVQNWNDGDLLQFFSVHTQRIRLVTKPYPGFWLLFSGFQFSALVFVAHMYETCPFFSWSRANIEETREAKSGDRPKSFWMCFGNMKTVLVMSLEHATTFIYNPTWRCWAISLNKWTAWAADGATWTNVGDGQRQCASSWGNNEYMWQTPCR